MLQFTLHCTGIWWIILLAYRNTRTVTDCMDYYILCIKQQSYNFSLDLWNIDSGQILTLSEHPPYWPLSDISVKLSIPYVIRQRKCNQLTAKIDYLYIHRRVIFIFCINKAFVSYSYMLFGWSAHSMPLVCWTKETAFLVRIFHVFLWTCSKLEHGITRKAGWIACITCANGHMGKKRWYVNFSGILP